MQAVDALGYAAAVLLTAMSIPQTIRVHRNGSRGVSSATWLIVSFAIAMWIGYGISHASLVLVIANIAGLIAASATLSILARSKGQSWTAAIALVSCYAVTCVIVSLVAPLALVTLAAVVLPIVSRLPQVGLCIQACWQGSATQVSRLTWTLSATGQSLWLSYGLIVHDGALVVVNLVCVLLTLVLLAVDIANPANRLRSHLGADLEPWIVEPAEAR